LYHSEQILGGLAPKSPYPPSKTLAPQWISPIGRQEVSSSWSAPAEPVDNFEQILFCCDEFFMEKEGQELLKLIFY